MAQFLDPSVELSLLQRRFPDVSVSECGKLISDFFCARQVASRTYEGRLFLTEKAILFVSTFSDAHDYDICIKFTDILIVTTFHKSIVPSIEFSLKEKEELFTNFYNLVAVATSLTALLPGKVLENKSTGSQRKLNRLQSVPARPVHRRSPTPPPPSYESVIKEDPPINKAPACPFFSKCGFCPRVPLCKLHHHLPGNSRPDPATTRTKSHDHHVTLSPCNREIYGNSYHGNTSLSLLSPSKRFHLQEDEHVSLLNVAERKNEASLDKKQNGTIEYNRSLSSPARVLDFSQEKASSSEDRGEQPKRASTDTVVQRQDGGNNVGTSLDEKSLEITSKQSQSEAEIDRGNRPVLDPTSPNVQREQSGKADVKENDTTPSLTVPSSFIFTSDSQGQGSSSPKHDERDSTKGQSSTEQVKPETAVTGSSNEANGDGVFVFTASSNPTSPEGDHVRRKNAAVTFKFGRLGEGGREGGASGEGGVGESDENLAQLAQQLELGSDNDSLQGDLDLDHQRKLFDSFTNAQGSPFFLPPGFSKLTSPPPRSKITLPPGTEEDNKDEKKSGESGAHKRRHCVYFLAGYCPNGTECPEFHGLTPEHYDDLEALMEEADIPLIEIPEKLKVFSANSLGRSDINSGDKIILSSHILMACEQLELSYPVAFKLEHSSSGNTVHAGVLEFTSPLPDNGYLPQWMMDHLGVKDGEEVDFKHVELPKGKFVRLQPVSSAWLGIPYDKRMAMMEFQLRNFQTLTEGTKVTLTYELNRYTLKVLECKPAKGISIVDADITTDIVEPADFNRYHSIEEGQAVNIGLDEPTRCTVDENTYRHFVLLFLPGQPLPSRLRVEVQSIKGDADLFLSQSCTAPSQVRYTWCDQDVGGSEFCLSVDDKDYDVNKPLYAGVVSLCEETEFTIIFHREDTMAAKNDRQRSPSGLASGRSLRDALPTEETDSSVDLPIETTPTTLPPGQGRCAYCGSVMQTLRLLMHERHCAQSTFKCPVCKMCLPKAAEKKHHFIAHEPLRCDCGIEATQLSLHHHQLTDCPKRSVKCPFKWCTLSFPMDQLQNHENLCGRKKVPCPLCNEEVSQLELEIHLEAFHSVDSTIIDWTKPIANQVINFKPSEPKFKCSCGIGFDFQDDYQVHQLTECPQAKLSEADKPEPVSCVDSIVDDSDIVG